MPWLAQFLFVVNRSNAVHWLFRYVVRYAMWPDASCRVVRLCFFLYINKLTFSRSIWGNWKSPKRKRDEGWWQEEGYLWAASCTLSCAKRSAFYYCQLYWFGNSCRQLIESPLRNWDGQSSPETYTYKSQVVAASRAFCGPVSAMSIISLSSVWYLIASQADHILTVI